MTYSEKHLLEVKSIIEKIDQSKIEEMVDLIVSIKNQKGRIFFIGVGGSAGNCSHAVNDFRKIVEIECYTPTDNVSELTARTNDEGWDSVFSDWLKISKLNNKDMIIVFSVGGGSSEQNISKNIVKAIDYGKSLGAKILGVVGRDGGHTAKLADVCLIIPTVNQETITPHTESFQSVVWHLIVSHPKLKTKQTKWESIKK